MSKKIELNGRTYVVPEVNFNAICELAERGIDVLNPQSMSKKPIPTARGIAAWIIGEDLEVAGNIIEKHIIAGSSIEPIFTTFVEAIEESGFIRSLTATAGETEDEPKVEEKPKTTRKK